MRGPFAMYGHNPAKGAQVAAICDIRPEMMEKFKQKRNLPDIYCTTDYRQLLARKRHQRRLRHHADCCHEEHAVAALKAGKAVYWKSRWPSASRAPTES